MVEKEKKNRSSTGAPDRRGRRIWWFVLLLIPLLLVCGAVFGAQALYNAWFSENERLVLRRLEIASRGYWNGRETELMRRLGLKGGIPLFAIEPRAIREKLERIPCVESARVYRALPDTLKIELNERIPRACLVKPGSQLVVDENAVVMTRSESLANDGKLELPVITGIRPAGMTPGASYRQLRPALELIMLTLRRYPMFHIRTVSIISPESMVCYFLYRGGRSYYRAVLPIRSRGLEFLLSALESAIIDVRRSGDSQRNFNLSYDGQVVVN